MGTSNLENWDEEMISEALSLLGSVSTIKDCDAYLEKLLQNMKGFQEIKKALEGFNTTLFMRSMIKLGNSIAITLPHKIKEELNLKPGDSAMLHYKKGMCFLYLGSTKESYDNDYLPAAILSEKENEQTQLQKIISYLEKNKIATVPFIFNETGVKKNCIYTYLSANKDKFYSPRRGVWCLKDDIPSEEEIYDFLTEKKITNGSE